MEIVFPGMYLAPISVMVYLCRTKVGHLDLTERYIKGSFRNTALIAGPNGTQSLKVPVKKHNNATVAEVLISNDEDWRRVHLRSIETAYGTAPFFEYYITEIKTIYEPDYKYLWEFNQALLTFLIIKLQLTTLEIKVHTEPIADIQSSIDLNLTPFFGMKIHQRIDFPLKPYPQVFEYKFGWQNDLSILDLLMCMGPVSKEYLLSQYLPPRTTTE